MMKRVSVYILLVILPTILGWGVCSSAQDRLIFEDFSIKQGETKRVAIQMENSVPVTAFQFDIYMPESISVEQSGNNYSISLAERATTTHAVYADEVSNGSIRVACYSSNSSAFNGNSGNIVYIDVKAANDFTGPVDISIKNIIVTSTDIKEYKLQDISATVTLQTSLPGDANDDNVIDVSDITTIASKILGKKPATFNEKNADANGDGKIDVADITTTAGIILRTVK